MRYSVPKERRNTGVEGILENDIVGGGMGIYLLQEILASDFNENQSELLAISASSTEKPWGRRIEAALGGLPAVHALLERRMEGADRKRL